MARSGRAFAYPVYLSAFERDDDFVFPSQDESADCREHVIRSYQDLARSIDYLETRAGIDLEKLAYMARSLGRKMGPSAGDGARNSARHRNRLASAHANAGRRVTRQQHRTESDTPAPALHRGDEPSLGIRSHLLGARTTAHDGSGHATLTAEVTLLTSRPVQVGVVVV